MLLRICFVLSLSRCGLFASNDKGLPRTTKYQCRYASACRNFSQTGEDAAPSTWALAISDHYATHTGCLNEPLIDSSHTKNQEISRDHQFKPSTLQLRSAEPQFALLLCTSLSILFYIHHVEDTTTAQSSRFCACIPLGLLPQWSPFCSPAVDKLAHRPQPAPNRYFHGAFTSGTRKSADWQCNQDGCELLSSFTYLQGSIRSIWLGECQSQTLMMYLPAKLHGLLNLLKSATACLAVHDLSRHIAWKTIRTLAAQGEMKCLWRILLVWGLLQQSAL